MVLAHEGELSLEHGYQIGYVGNELGGFDLGTGEIAAAAEMVDNVEKGGRIVLEEVEFVWGEFQGGEEQGLVQLSCAVNQPLYIHVDLFGDEVVELK